MILKKVIPGISFFIETAVWAICSVDPIPSQLEFSPESTQTLPYSAEPVKSKARERHGNSNRQSDSQKTRTRCSTSGFPGCSLEDGNSRGVEPFSSQGALWSFLVSLPTAMSGVRPRCQDDAFQDSVRLLRSVAIEQHSHTK